MGEGHTSTPKGGYNGVDRGLSQMRSRSGLISKGTTCGSEQTLFLRCSECTPHGAFIARYRETGSYSATLDTGKDSRHEDSIGGVVDNLGDHVAKGLRRVREREKEREESDGPEGRDGEDKPDRSFFLCLRAHDFMAQPRQKAKPGQGPIMAHKRTRQSARAVKKAIFDVNSSTLFCFTIQVSTWTLIESGYSGLPPTS